MSVKRGCLGKIFGSALSATANSEVDEVNSWSFEESAAQEDASKIGTCTKKFEAGAKQTTGQITVWWEPAATGNQGAFSVGEKVNLALYPGGNGSGDTYYKTTTGEGATITSVSRSGGVDGLAGSVFGFSVNGGLTATTVP